MKTNIKLVLVIIIASACTLLSTSCQKKNQTGSMSVSMTDAPGDYLAVNVEILGMQVNHQNSGWITLPVNQGVYNLLDLQNNVTVVLASNVQVPVGPVNQLRLLLGPNNSIVDSTGTYPLKVPSGEESGLKININQTITTNNNLSILFDFDAGQSVVETGNHTYILKPVLKFKAVL